MYKCKKKDCIYCKNHGGHGSKSGSLCHYMLDTGEKCGCPADKCDKYTPKERKKAVKC